MDLLAVVEDLPLARIDQAGENMKQGRLAGAIGSQKPVNGSFFKSRGHVSDSFGTAEIFSNLTAFQNRIHNNFSSRPHESADSAF
ncbi:hypothetical protein D3C73_1481760 [compost metagenome]